MIKIYPQIVKYTALIPEAQIIYISTDTHSASFYKYFKSIHKSKFSKRIFNNLTIYQFKGILKLKFFFFIYPVE